MAHIQTFLLFSLLGFLLESLHRLLCTPGGPGRKCLLFLPLCPVYGASVTLLTLLPRELLASPLLLFPAAALLCTLTEYLFALLYERLWRVRFWDYRRRPFQLQGRVCLRFSLLWGLLAALLLPPLLGPLALLGELLPPRLTAALFAAFLADSLCTGLLLRRTGSLASLRWWQPFLSPPGLDRRPASSL